jgi:hypothetical protein
MTRAPRGPKGQLLHCNKTHFTGESPEVNRFHQDAEATALAESQQT